MNTIELENTLTQWANHSDVALTHESLGGRLCYELSWKNQNGLNGYIDLYPQQNDVIVVQYGTFDPQTSDRTHAGMTKWRCGTDLPNNLSRVRSKVEEAEPLELSYSPAPRIGSVNSLKLR
jgi:hypothetical protein